MNVGTVTAPRENPREVVGLCPRCGFDDEELTPEAAALLARSLAKRWRRLLYDAAEIDLEGAPMPETLLQDGTTLLQRAQRVVRVFTDAARALRVIGLNLVVTDELGRSSVPFPCDWSLHETAAALESAGELFGMRAETCDHDIWGRPVHWNANEVTAFEITRDAIHTAHHDLRVTVDELTPDALGA